MLHSTSFFADSAPQTKSNFIDFFMMSGVIKVCNIGVKLTGGSWLHVTVYEVQIMFNSLFFDSGGKRIKEGNCEGISSLFYIVVFMMLRSIICKSDISGVFQRIPETHSDGASHTFFYIILRLFLPKCM